MRRSSDLRGSEGDAKEDLQFHRQFTRRFLRTRFVVCLPVCL